MQLGLQLDVESRRYGRANQIASLALASFAKIAVLTMQITWQRPFLAGPCARGLGWSPRWLGPTIIQGAAWSDALWVRRGPVRAIETQRGPFVLMERFALQRNSFCGWLQAEAEAPRQSAQGVRRQMQRVGTVAAGSSVRRR